MSNWTPRALIAIFGLLGADAAAQGFRRTSLQPLAVDQAARMIAENPWQPRGSHGWPSTARNPAGAAARYWYWNRDQMLPQPKAAAAVVVVGSDGGGTSARASRTAWLFGVARSDDAALRSYAVYAIGCAGPAAHGYAQLVFALDDEDAAVRTAALLGLGEHAGTKARFLLAKELLDGGRQPAYRQTAALAFGMACAVDGRSGGRSLTGVAAVEPASWRETLCAADLLAGGDALGTLTPGWLANHAEPGERAMPAIAVSSAVASAGRDQVLARLKGVFGSSQQPLRLASRRAALRYGTVSAAALKKWMAAPLPEDRAFTALAAIGHDGFPAIAKAGFDTATLRGVCALGLALHARVKDYPNALRELLAASRNQRSFHERPLWLLAIALAGDRAASARARALLVEPRTPLALRLAAVDVLALDRSGDRLFLRRAVHLDAAVSVRLQAADGVARHGSADDVKTLLHAVEHAGTAAERASLLVSLGRTRHYAVAATLRRWCTNESAPAPVRHGAWLGLAHSLRHTVEAPLARLPRGIGFCFLPAPLLDLADSQR